MAKKDNSDSMSRKQDEELEQLEERLTALYANAANEINSKLTDFMDAYKKQDEKKQAEVEAGTLSPEEYSTWRRTQMLNNSRYTAAVESMTNTLVNTDAAAMAAVNGQMPRVVAQSYDYVSALGSISAEKQGITKATVQIYNARTIQELEKKKPDLFPKPRVDIDEDKRWNKDRIRREMTQGILQGEPIGNIADRLQRVTTMDRNAAVRNARTAFTSAENLGRSEAADDLKAQGIPVEEVWSATYDKRTRDSHLLLDGTTRDASGFFGVGIITTPLRYPGDPDGDPEEVYNCRCRLNIQLQGIDHSKDDDLYEKFMKENHPEDWENLQNNEPYQARQAEAAATKERKAELESQQQELKEKAEPEKAEPEEKDNGNEKWGGHQDDGVQYIMAGQITDEGIDAMMKDLGVTKYEAQDMSDAIIGYSGSDFQYVRCASQGDFETMHRIEEENGDWIDEDEMKKKAEDIEKFIDLSPKWDGGELERGIHIKNDDDLAALIERAKSGEAIDMRGMSSWTSSDDTARNFAEAWNSRTNSVVLKTNEKKTDLGTSIRHLSRSKEEDEILVSKDAEFKPTRVETIDGVTYIYGDIRRKKK